MIEFIIITICLILNAILSCVEMAFVTVSKPHLKKLASAGDKAAQKLLLLNTNPERVLSVLQIGITLVGAISAAVGGAGAEESLSPLFQRYFSTSEETSETLALVSVVLPITYLSVVIGELVPKTLALRSPMKFAKLGALFLVPLDKIFSPIVSTLEISTRLLVKPFVNKLTKEYTVESPPEIDLEPLSDSHKQYVFNLLSVDKRRAKDIMIPWNQVTTLDYDWSVNAVVQKLRESRYARIPVISSSKTVGILNFREFFCEPDISRIDWTNLIKPVVYIGSEEPILNILKTMQKNSIHLVVVHKNNQAIGIVTLEDILEEIIGEIYDEDDRLEVLLASNSKIRRMGR